ncbi:BglG family transcription antiterminator [Lentibacillus sp. Marseille-P4043]|uniref:BglG family transcription antiterminator n=1 Tax=Lentibacillus sp. Marseille-P4043 TaxID=2040293 RepID=UPI001F370A12|nr:PRD domain-containing protein [Lentibacillus sp. Marseille-P4043]
MNSLYISGRERKIIELLLHAEEEVTVKEIASNLEVSERTIHRDLKNIEKIAFDHNLELRKKSGIGLRIIGDENNKQQLERRLSSAAPSDFTSEERQAIILSTLLGTKEPIKLFTLANELKVTNATISNDLDQIADELANFHLDIVRKRGYGVKVEGNEADKRAAISKLITKYVDPFEYISLLKENIQKKSIHQLNSISNRLLGLVNLETLNKIEEKVEQVRDELPHELADNAYIGLVVHLALAIERLNKGDKIAFDQVFMRQIEGTKEYEIAKKIIQDLEVSLSMDIPDDEIGYITMHLMGAKLRVDNNYEIEDSSLKIAFKAKELIQYVSSLLKVDLVENDSLLNGLVAHLKPAIYRLKQGMNITNPLINEIRKNYPELFRDIQEGVNKAFADVTFQDDEIGYLVLHFAAALLDKEEEVDLRALIICSSGIGTAKILATKLTQQFPEIKHVENKSLFDLNHLNPEIYDIVVSTIPLKDFAGDYILTSPILSQAELHRIKKVIQQKKLVLKAKGSRLQAETGPEDKQASDFILKLEAIQSYSKIILYLLTSFYVKQIMEKRSLPSILRLICKDLAEKQWVENEEEIVRKLLQREQLSGLGIPDSSLALFHTRSNNVTYPSFTIYPLQHPLSVQGMDGKRMEMDRLLLMLAPETTQQEVLEVLSFLSGILIQDQESVKLFETGDETQIKQFLSKQFQTFLQEKNLW